MSKAGYGEYMNVAEVARYLGVNEKKVYFLAKTGKIPCTRVTGKWTFPRHLIDRWIGESADGNTQRSEGSAERTFVLGAGSDDPSLALLQKLFRAEKDACLFMATVGSGAGLKSIRSGVADFATAHLLEPARSPRGAAELWVSKDTAVVQLFYRELGWVVRRGNPHGVESARDLVRPGLRFINRQAGSGTRLYLEQELARARVKGSRIAGYEETVATHLEVGLGVLSGRCDVGLATRTAAQLLGLDFIRLTRERFDLLVPKERFFTKGVQELLGIVGSRDFRDGVAGLGGYDVSESGRMIGSR